MSKPSHIARTPRNYLDADGIEKTRWHDIGVAWATKSGTGFNVSLYALPIDGQFSLFLPTA